MEDTTKIVDTITQALTLLEWVANDENKHHLKIASNIVGISLTEYGIDLLFRLMDALAKRGGDLSLDEITSIQFRLEQEYKEKATMVTQ